jgi:hypothetical protein
MPAVDTRRAQAPRQPGSSASPGGQAKPEAEILFQKYFKSVGPRTYAAQLKRAGNGNHFLVLTEGKRDDKTGEVRKTRLFLFGEDFVEFFRMLHDTAQFIRGNPVPEDVRKKRERFWAKKEEGGADSGSAPGRAPRRGPAEILGKASSSDRTTSAARSAPTRSR